MPFQIEDRGGLEVTIYHLNNMYKRRDSARTEPSWDEERRRQEVENEVFMIRKLEAQIAEFFHGTPLDDGNYPEILDTLRAMEEARRNREAVENLPTLPQKV